MRNALWLDSLTITEEPRRRMKPCDHCDTATPAKTLREVTASDGWTGDVCGNCHYDFHKMHVQIKATENA